MDYRLREQWEVATRRIIRGACTGAFLGILALAATAAPVYTIQELGNLPGRNYSGDAVDINDSGQVVVASGEGAFLWEAGSGMVEIGHLPGSEFGRFDPFAINNSGQVVGMITRRTSHVTETRPFLWEAGSGTVEISVPAGSSYYSVALAINDGGQVVGHYEIPGAPYAFLWEAGNGLTDIGGLPGREDHSSAEAVNNSGQVVGWSSEENVPGIYGFLWEADTGFTNLGDLPGGFRYTSPSAINDRGQVVGGSGAETGIHAFLWEPGVGMTDLGDLPGRQERSFANAINNRGQVVGRGYTRAFLWEADFGMLQLDSLIDPLDPLFGTQLGNASAINNSGQIVADGWIPGTDESDGPFLLTPVQTPLPHAFLHCSRDLSTDGTVGLAVVTSDQVTIKGLDGTWIGQFALSGLDDLIDTELMADTNGNGAPELVALSQSSARAVVRDLLSGADLGTIDLPADLAPIALELADDQTGNGIPDFSILGRDPMRVQVRDGLTSNLVSDVGFTRYVTAKDLTVYPDLDGSGDPALAVLAENRQPGNADKIEIRNASSGETIRQIWLGKDWDMLAQERIGDLNGNGSEEIAVLQKHARPPGNVRVQIRDIETRAWVNFVGFDNKYSPVTLVAVPDFNGNGADELVVFGRHGARLNQKAMIKDAKTGEQLNQLWFDRAFPGHDFVSCGDINGNGAADVALLGQWRKDGRFQVVVKDARTGERLAFVRF